MSTTSDQELGTSVVGDMLGGDAATNGTVTGPPEARATELPAPLAPALLAPSDFRFDAVHAIPAIPPAPAPSLGPLAHFRGTFHGNGFNTIFRPDNSVTRLTSQHRWGRATTFSSSTSRMRRCLSRRIWDRCRIADRSKEMHS